MDVVCIFNQSATALQRCKIVFLIIIIIFHIITLPGELLVLRPPSSSSSFFFVVFVSLHFLSDFTFVALTH